MWCTGLKGVFIAAGLLVSLTTASYAQRAKQPPYMNPALPAEQRAADLVHRMSLAEKVGQMISAAPAIPRLDVPAYNYWNETLHGVARAGYATMFPQAIGMAATWDAPLFHQIGDITSTEVRAKNSEALRQGNHSVQPGSYRISVGSTQPDDPRALPRPRERVSQL